MGIIDLITRSDTVSFTMVKFAFAVLAGVVSAGGTDSISAECTQNNQIKVDLETEASRYLVKASYGNCSEVDLGINTTASNYYWTVMLDPASCGMTSNTHTANFDFGVQDGNDSLIMQTFDMNTECDFTDEYEIEFNYGTLEASTESFTGDGGELNITFAVAAYDSSWSEYANQTDAPVRGGERIRIGLTVTSSGFSHASSYTSPTSGKLFAPTKAVVVETGSGDTYTLFDTATSCSNTHIGLSVSYFSNMWAIEHILFLLGDSTSAEYKLKITIIVCEYGDAAACQAVYNAC